MQTFFLVLARALPVILTSASKSTNSLGYRELREPIRARENGYRLLWLILILVITIGKENALEL